MNHTIVRLFYSADLPACEEIYLQGRQQAFHWFSADFFHRQDFSKDTVGEKILIAEQNNTIAGFISFHIRKHFIHTLFIHPEQQGKGLGSALLDVALHQLKGSATLHCILGNLRARQFYEKRDWRPIGQGRDHMGPWVAYKKG